MASKTPEDFWQLAASHDKTARKWRVGDAAKGARGFLRAIEVYTTGLQQHPANFELAYNRKEIYGSVKAPTRTAHGLHAVGGLVLIYYRAQAYMTIIQEPRFLPYLPSPQVDFLRSTIEANRYVLNLNPKTADVLFNTGQALSSLAEELSEQDASKSEAIALLAEALDLYDKCLAQQAKLITEANEMVREAESEAQMRAEIESQELDYDVLPMETDAKKGSNEDQDMHREQTEVNATLIDPTTEDDMIDTGLAKLSAMTILCALYDHMSHMAVGLFVANPSLSFLEQTASDLLENGVLAVRPQTQDPTRLRAIEIFLARASFMCALSAAYYRARHTDVSTYHARIEAAYSDITSNVPSSDQSSEVLCAYAESLMDFASTVTEIHAHLHTYTPPFPSPAVDPAHWPRVRWRALSHAQSLLKTAADLPNASKDPLAQSRIFALRAAVELFRLRAMAAFKEDWQKPEWSANGVVAADSGVESKGVQGGPQGNLVGNAGVYYRGAVKWLRAAEGTTWKERVWKTAGDEERDLFVREWVVNMLKVMVLEEGKGLQWKIEAGLERFQDSVEMGEEGLEMVAKVVKDMGEERLLPFLFADSLYGHVSKAIEVLDLPIP